MKFVPLGLEFYDELSDFLHCNTAKLVDLEIKIIFIFLSSNHPQFIDLLDDTFAKH
jgi:hypothetical protein